VNAHIDAAIPNFLIQECNCFPYSAIAEEVLTGLPSIADGYLELPHKPYDRPIIVQRDGSIGLE
jgi:hypothetical protein